ncbi:MAG: GNAT family N-acetyltransferase [Planctomycetota bacterium]|nr:GNAT family N-acetyltransferase [Planctomycetota bacterium]
MTGRIAAIIDCGHNDRFKEKRGFFGFFDCRDDQVAADLLFTEAGRYLKIEGMENVRGPCNPSLNYESGALVQGFDTPPTFMMTYNGPYYDKLIKGFGFEKSQDLYAFEGNLDTLKTMDSKIQFIADEAKRRFCIKVRTADKNKLGDDIRLFLKIYNQSSKGTWGFVPYSEAECEGLAKSLPFIVDPRLISFAEVNGKTVAAAMCLPDYNPLIKRINGRFFPIGFLSFFFGRRQIKKVRIMSANVIPEYQKWGIGLVILERMIPRCLEQNITDAEFSWVLESNKLSRGTLERAGTIHTKTFRLYDRSLNDISA